MTEIVDATYPVDITLSAAPTPANLEWIRDHYDTNKNCYIDEAELAKAETDYNNLTITMDELFAIIAACDNHMLLPAYPTPPVPPPAGNADPSMNPIPKSLEVGDHNITITKSNYETVTAKITVSSSGQVSCNDAVCLASGYPRVNASGDAVAVYMKAGTTTGGYDAWLVSKGGLSSIDLPGIFELKDVFIGLPGNLDFVPTLPQIMECKDAFIGL